MTHQNYSDFHAKYRPSTLDTMIGHTDAVTRLKGMIAKGKIPGAVLFLGPSSVGKTTLARALAVEFNGKSIDAQAGDYKELNAGDTRSIEDMRELIRLSKFKPSGKRRIFVIDEAQQLLSNATAAAALLKPLEEASKEGSGVTWVLCSMDPSKFTTGNGKAIANRCTQFVLGPHSNGDLLKQAKRIVKKEELTYLDEDLLKTLVKASNSEMRTVANLLQGVRDYAEGMERKPKKLDPEVLSKVVQSAESNDDVLAADVIVGVLTGKFAAVQMALLSVADGFQFINKLMWTSSYLLNQAVLNGQRHPKVWPSKTAKDVLTRLKGTKVTLGHYAALNEAVVNLKIQAGSFSVDEMALVSARMYRLIKDLFSSEKDKE